MTAVRRYSTPLLKPFPPLPLIGPTCQLDVAYDSLLGTPIVGVIGVGYVGLSLVTAFSRHFKVIAFDISEERVQSLKNCHSELCNVAWTSSPSALHAATHVLISVPTLVLPDGSINTSHLEGAIRTLSQYCKPGCTIVIESSVAVGMTRQMLAPVMESLGFRGGMSPERVDPGRQDPPFVKIPKVISGLDDICPGSLQSITDLYSQVFETLVPVSTPEVAEMTKLYENCQRMVCISFSNEMADACKQSNINPYEVANAAATKPFGYLPVYPGLGVGGHCIPVNPFYLFSTHSFPLLAAATDVANQRPAQKADELMIALSRQRSWSATGDPKVLVAGMAFKRGQSLTTNSPGVAMLRHFHASWKVSCFWFDPLIAEADYPKHAQRMDPKHWTSHHLEGFDLIVVAMNQESMDMQALATLRRPLVEVFCKG